MMIQLPNLTKNQGLVYGVLSKAGHPLSAYRILDDLREVGFRAPPQVYRALEKLQELGLIHRLESLNAFVACQHQHCEPHRLVAFTICEDCGQVIELAQTGIENPVLELAQEQGFQARMTSIEMRGTCQNCR